MSSFQLARHVARLLRDEQQKRPWFNGVSVRAHKTEGFVVVVRVSTSVNEERESYRREGVLVLNEIGDEAHTLTDVP